jgi:AcrR family transcriptional regulator
MYHDLVFECAERVFAKRGVNDSSMQDIASEAGISLKTLYNTFAGKDELYREILAMRSAGLVAAVNRSVAADGTAFERLSVGIREIVGYLVANRPFFQILLHEGKAWGLDPRGKAAREAWQLGRSAVANVLQRGMEDGEILAGDADLLAATVNAVLQVQLAGRLEQVAEPDADDLADQILVLLRRLLCRGDTPDIAVA